MTVFKFLKFPHLAFAFGLAMFLAAGQAVAQEIEEMNPSQLLATLKQNISDFQQTESRIAANDRLAEDNRIEIKTLRLESQSLDNQAASYDDRVVRHNRLAGNYNDQCLGKKLPEDVYDQCMELKANLDTTRAELDEDVEKLQQSYDAYNLRVTALRESESARAGESNQLLDRYQALDESIRSIQVRLYDLATRRDESGFSEQVRQCTLNDDLDEVYSCMENAWGG